MFIAAILILLVTILGTAYLNDHVSCVRSARVRMRLYVFFREQERRADLRALSGPRAGANA